MVERFREQLFTEKLADRITCMLADAERAAGPEPTDPDAAPRPAIDADVQAALRMTERSERRRVARQGRAPSAAQDVETAAAAMTGPHDLVIQCAGRSRLAAARARAVVAGAAALEMA